MPDSATHRHVSILSDQAGHDRGNSLGSSLISRYSRYSQRACNVGRRTQLSIPLAFQDVASCNCRKFHIDKFFCDRHTIVAAASQFAVSREFVERVASAIRVDERRSRSVSHRICLPEHSISGKFRQRANCPRCYWTVRGGSIVTILRHLLVVLLAGIASATSARKLVAGALLALFAAASPAGAVSEFGTRDEAVAMC